MNKYIYILSKIFTNRTNPLYSLSNFSTVISNILCVLFISITLSISNGFKNNVILKITQIDGYARIDKQIPYNELREIEDDNFNFINVNTYNLIIRNNSYAEGVNLVALDNKESIIADYIISVKAKEGLILGEDLYNRLEIDNNNKVFLYGYNYLTGSKEIIQTEVVGYFKTDIPDFDSYRVYGDNKIMNSINIKPKRSTLIIPLKSFQTSNEDEYLNNLNTNYLFRGNLILWKDSQYKDFYEWLDNYETPIYFLLFLILIIGIVNNMTCYNIDRINRSKEIYILKVLGMNKNDINSIFYIKSVLLNIIGIVIGSLISITILYIESKYHFIKLPSDIYFSDVLPIDIKTKFYIYPGIILIISNLIILISSNQLYNKNE